MYASSRSRRFGHSPGFYKALDSHSTADYHDATSRNEAASVRPLSIVDSPGASGALPEGCYLVDRVVTERKGEVTVYKLYTKGI